MVLDICWAFFVNRGCGVSSRALLFLMWKDNLAEHENQSDKAKTDRQIYRDRPLSASNDANKASDERSYSSSRSSKSWNSQDRVTKERGTATLSRSNKNSE